MKNEIRVNRVGNAGTSEIRALDLGIGTDMLEDEIHADISGHTKERSDLGDVAPSDKYFMVHIMRAASDLINTYDAGLSNGAIKTRMRRIADDLIYVLESDAVIK
jgi:hypothetical protein